MRITFEIPELFITFSFIFFLRGMYWPGGVIMTCGLFLAVFRFSFELQRRKEEEIKKLELINQISDGIINLFPKFTENSSNKFH